MGYYMSGGPMNGVLLERTGVARGATQAGADLARALGAAARPQVATALSGGGGGGGWGGSGGLLARAPAPLAPIDYGPDGYGYEPRPRRMNPLNPRALRRSMRRVQAFAKFARKTISFTQRVKMKRRK